MTTKQEVRTIRDLTDAELRAERDILAERVEVIQFDMSNLNQTKAGRRMNVYEWNAWRVNKKSELADTLRRLREVKGELLRRFEVSQGTAGDKSGSRRAVNILAELVVALQGVPVPEAAATLMREARDRQMVKHAGISVTEI